MHAVDLVSMALGEPAISPTGTGICCVTGEESPCINRSEILGKSFTAQALLRAPTSDLISVRAAHALGHGPERKSSWWCDGKEFRPLNRLAVRDMIVFGRESKQPWAGYVTTSYKKHGALMAPVNGPSSALWLFEMEVADMRTAIIAPAWKKLTEMQLAGAPRPVLETLEESPYVMAKVGVKRWLDFSAWARCIYQGATYKLLCYLLPSKDELAEAKKSTEPQMDLAL